MGIKEWFFSLWQSDARRVFSRFILKALKIFLGAVADDLQEIAVEEVKKAEATGKNGAEKYMIAYSGIKERLGNLDIPEYLVNIAIESAVALIDPKI